MIVKPLPAVMARLVYMTSSPVFPLALAACLLAAETLPAAPPVIFARAVTRADESIRVLTLAEARTAPADMATMILIGTATTRLIERPGAAPFVYTPRKVAG